MKLLKSAFLIAGLALSSAASCQETAPPAAAVANAPDEASAAIGSPEAGKALVVFFRPSAFKGAAIGFIVREGETELGKLKNGNFFTAQVAPGKHDYTVHSEAKDVTSIEAEEGETYFLSGEINMGFMAGRPNLAPSDLEAFKAAFKKLKPSKPLE
jgi:hypothetical protein